jgi:hypothetical protein
MRRIPLLAVLFILVPCMFPWVALKASSLPMSKTFRGQAVFSRLVARAEKEHWRALPISDRIVTVGKALLGTPYVNFTLEIDDRIEAPSVDLVGLDCWTFFEVSLGFARMLEVKSGHYTPQDLLAMIQLDRYRGGVCNGRYTSRLHYLEDWIDDNARRGLVIDMTRRLGGIPIEGHYLNEMSKTWPTSRYMRHDPSLIAGIRQIEERIQARTNYYIPSAKIPEIESQLKNGDVICITNHGPEGYTEHVGLAYRDPTTGSVRFLHASKDGHRVMIDVPIRQYVYRYRRFSGIMVARPSDVLSRGLKAQGSIF